MTLLKRNKDCQTSNTRVENEVSSRIGDPLFSRQLDTALIRSNQSFQSVERSEERLIKIRF